MSVVRIRESPYYKEFFLKKISENFVGTLGTVRIKEVSVPRGSTVILTYFTPRAGDIVVADCTEPDSLMTGHFLIGLEI